MEHRRRDQGDRTPGPGRDSGRTSRQLGPRHRHHRQRHRRHGVLETARLIAHSGVKPKRTIRFILFSGEEEGLLGSRAYAAAHAAEADSIQAVLVLDNGTGAITGQALQGRDDLERTSGTSCSPRSRRSAPTACGRPIKMRHRSPVVPAVWRPRVQLRPARAGLQPHASLGERHLRQGGRGRSEAGGGGHGGDGGGARESAGAVAAGAEERAGESTRPRPSSAGRRGAGATLTLSGRTASVDGTRRVEPPRVL